MFDQNDKDHDGSVDFKEFLNIIIGTFHHDLMMKTEEGRA
jgi:Ca2+-binding EF-hand superfamily protein